MPPRFQIFVGVFVILVATLFFDRSRWFDRPALFVALALLLLAEQVHRAEGWGVRRAEQAWVFTEIPEPPAACRAFFVLRPRPRLNVSPGNDTFYSHSVDAMMIAERFNLIFRTDFLNATNTPQFFPGPITDANSGNFGRIAGAMDQSNLPRFIQISLKLQF